MTNFRKYGSPPYKVIVLHGGPGAPGYMAPVAKELSKTRGIIEPFQTKDSIAEQVEELYSILQEHANLPVILIGHSWGGFLGLIFENKYSEHVSKIIFISSGPFEDKYIPLMRETRATRLSIKDQEENRRINKLLYIKSDSNKTLLLKKLARLSSKTDSYHLIPSKSDVIEYQPNIHNKVWNEAVEMRKDGKFLEFIKKIRCPVAAIHGDFDPHPYEAVRIPFSKYAKTFDFILLEKCGHYPWLEKYAKESFYISLNKILNY